jgi:hypothetical protein
MDIQFTLKQRNNSKEVSLIGYWSQHPMAGDHPLDLQYDFLSAVIGTKLYSSLTDENNYDKIKELFIREIQSGSVEKLLMERGDDFEFIPPFVIADYAIIIADKHLSGLLKDMISDGGADNRGYDENESPSPQVYADDLREKWDGLMDGTIPFSTLERCTGLLETIVTSTKSGLVNVI